MGLPMSILILVICDAGAGYSKRENEATGYLRYTRSSRAEPTTSRSYIASNSIRARKLAEGSLLLE